MNDIEDATIKHLREKAEFDMPPEMHGLFYNGSCTEPCDMIDGPCACGATHSAKEWIEKLTKNISQLKIQLDAEKDESIRLRDASGDVLGHIRVDAFMECSIAEYCEEILTQALKMKP